MVSLNFIVFLPFLMDLGRRSVKVQSEIHTRKSARVMEKLSCGNRFTALTGMSTGRNNSPSEFFAQCTMTLVRHFRCLWCAKLFAALLLAGLFTTSAEAQFYAGALGGISTLSGDTAASVNSTSADFSTYNPQNGLALNALFGRHFNDFLTVQGDYVWNRNALHLSAAASGSGSIGDYEETRRSSQQSLFASVLVYFRKRESRIRPYLSVGTGWVHLSSTDETITVMQGLPLPPHDFSANMIALRVPVGMDVRLHNGWLFRYTFSETLSRNPISDELSPPGPHSLKNFQNLFGIVRQF
jgi:hypothetical protein